LTTKSDHITPEEATQFIRDNQQRFAKLFHDTADRLLALMLDGEPAARNDANRALRALLRAGASDPALASAKGARKPRCKRSTLKCP
jgi:hypothetical protein